jgi:Family of unknown function (DUF6492)
MSESVAFVTVSYGPDRDRCALLSRSLEMFAPTGEHWIIVDRADLPLFRSLGNGRTTLVETEELLPVWLRRLNLRRLGLRSNIWIQTRGKPVRGWLLQQLAKLALAEQLTTDVLVHVDSDVVLVRPFRISQLADRAGRVRLYERSEGVYETLPDLVLWHRSAEELLGIRPSQLPLPDYITSFVPWKRQNAVSLLEHVETVAGRHWLRAVAAAWNVSEYILYGRFARDVLGDEAGQYVTASSLCLDYWTPTPLSERELDAFLDQLGPEEIAVSITAKAGMKPTDYAKVVERRWSLLDE